MSPFHVSPVCARALAVVLILFLSASMAHAEGGFEEKLNRLAETYKKWGITVDVGKEGAYDGRQGLTYLKLTGSLESADTVSLGVDAGFQDPTVKEDSDKIGVGINGNFEQDSAGTSLTGGGTVNVKGTIASFTYSKEKGLQLEAGLEKKLGPLGVQFRVQYGDEDRGRLELELQAGSTTVKVDLSKWLKQFRTVMPGMPEALSKKFGFTIRTDPAVGGVLMRFEPAGFQGGVSEAEAARIQQQIRQLLPGGGMILRRAPKESLQMVSLRRVLYSDMKTLGTLTRIRGYVAGQKGDLYLVGVAEPGRKPITLDLLTVALRSVWKQKQWPFISLDPENPEDLAGGHRARIGGIPRELEETEFVQIMLEADYAMKQIDLGKRRPSIPGFRRWIDLVSKRKRGSQALYSRAWLAPLIHPVGDLHETRRGSATAVTFESGVQVLTENMKPVGDLLVGTGESDPSAEEAAANMTRHFQTLEAQIPAFHRLHSVFDLAKLCAIWRTRGVQSDLLEKIAARTPARVHIKRSYAGLSSLVGGEVSVSGGATTRSRVSTKTVVLTDRLTPLLSAAAGNWTSAQRPVGEITLPATIQIDPSKLAGFNVETLLHAAIEDHSHARYRPALDRLNLAIELDPEFGEAHAYRALTLYSLGRIPEALRDMDRAVEFEPRLLAFRGLLRVLSGEIPRGLRDAQESEKAYPADEQILNWCAMARIYGLDLQRAERTLDQLQKVAPVSAGLYNLRGFIDLLHRMGPARAKETIAKLRRVPLPIMEAYAAGLTRMQAFDIDGAVESLRKCLALIRSAGSSPAITDLHLEDRCMVNLALALSGQSKRRMDSLRGLGALVELQDIQLRTMDPRAAGGLPDSQFLALLRSFSEVRGELVRLDAERESARKTAREALRICDSIIARHPDWPSGHIIKSIVAIQTGEGPKSAASTFESGLRMKANASRDPLLENLSLAQGTDRALAHFGLLLWYELARSRPQSDGHLGPRFDEESRDEAIAGHLDRIAPLLGDSPEGKMLNAIRARAKKSPAEALELFRGIDAGVPNDLSADAVSVLTAGFFYNGLLNLESEVGGGKRQAEYALKFLRLSAGDYRSWDALTLASLFRLNATLALVETYMKRYPNAPVQDAVAAARAESGEFVAGWVEFMMRLTRDGRDPRAVANGFTGLVKYARTPVDVRSLSVMADLLKVLAQMVEQGDPAMAAGIRKTFSGLSASLNRKLGVPAQSSHSWSGWEWPAIASSDSPAEGGVLAQSVSKNPSIALGAFLAGAGLFAVILRRRKTA